MAPAVAGIVNDPRLVFDDNAHRYTLEGHELISVTTALREGGLMDTAHFTEAARLRGQYVHEAIALYVRGELEPGSLDPLIEPYFEAWHAFLAATGITIEVTEQRVCDPVYGYAGTLDAIGRWPGPYGKRAVLDWKSGLFPPMAGPQTAAYLRCARAWYATGTRLGRAGLQLRDDGTYRFYEFTDLVQDEADFFAALRVAQFRRRHGLGSYS